MSVAEHEGEQTPIFTTRRLLSVSALLFATCLLGLVFLASKCFDNPIQTTVDLEHKGVQVLRTFKFRNPEQSYTYGFAFRPTFVKGDYWAYAPGFEAEEKKAWTELSPTVDILIIDSSGVIRMRETSRLSSEAGWTMTNGSYEHLPASVYKFITFKPIAGERYQVRVYVVQGCAGANALTPQFFIEMPTSGP